MDLTYLLRGEPIALSVNEKDGRLHVAAGDETVVVDSYEIDERYVTLEVAGRLVRLLYARAGGHIHVAARGESYEFVPASDDDTAARAAGAFVAQITSPMPGKVLALKVAVGDEVDADQALLILEAMKMEQTVRAPARARVAEVCVEAGAMIGPGAVLVVLEEIEETPQA